METEEDRQQIAIPPDLFKDFEAIRSQTKLGAEDLMRHLLKEYQRYPCYNLPDCLLAANFVIC